jgi:hypothetical protein
VITNAHRGPARRKAVKTRRERAAAARRAAPEPDAEYLTPAHVGRKIHTTEAALAVRRCKGLGPPYLKMGSKILYPAAALREWLAARTKLLPKKTAAA